MNRRILSFSGLLLVSACLMAGCSKKGSAGDPGGGPDTTTTPQAFDINSIGDTYADISDFTYYTKWGPYNVHDPSIKKFGDYYYCYSTDVGFGAAVPAGLRVRKSKNLVEWK